MLKGAQASADAPVQMVDLMTWVDGRMKAVKPKGAPTSASPAPAPETH
jgi:hypothetical protein